MKVSALVAWPILPLTIGILVLLFGEPRDQSVLVFSIILFVSTAVSLVSFTYAAYMEDKA